MAGLFGFWECRIRNAVIRMGVSKRCGILGGVETSDRDGCATTSAETCSESGRRRTAEAAHPEIARGDLELKADRQVNHFLFDTIAGQKRRDVTHVHRPEIDVVVVEPVFENQMPGVSKSALE